MKYKVGDKVRIVKEKQGRDWNSEGLMDKWLGEVMTIRTVNLYTYCMEEDKGRWYWHEHMIEGKVTEMNKSHLIAGRHVVETRAGDKYLIFDSEDGKFMYQVDGGGFMDLEGYDEDMLKINKHNSYDIMKVFEVETACNRTGFNREDNRYLALIWEREEPKEMTMAELEEKLGYKVKIVKEHE